MTSEDHWKRDPLKQSGSVGCTVVGTTATQIVAANPKRRTLHLAAFSASQIWVGTNPAVQASADYPITQSGGGLKLTIEEHGSIVTMAWYGIGGAGTDAVGWMDINNGT